MIDVLKEILEFINKPKQDISSGDIYIVKIVIISLIIYIIYKMIKQKKSHIASNILINKASIVSYALDLKQKVKTDTFFNKYKEHLRDMLNLTTNYLGELKIFSYSTWKKHFIFSLIYTLLFFYFSSLFGANGNLLNEDFFYNKNTTYSFATLLSNIIIILFVVTNAKVLKIKNYFISIIISLILAFVIIKVGVVAVLLILLLAYLLELVHNELYIFFGIKLNVFRIIVVLFIVITFYTLVYGFSYSSIFFFIFFIILPFINSIFDYISMYFSRNFAYKILKTQKKWKIFADLLIDTAIAIVLLYLLAICLFYILYYFNYFISDEKFKIPIEYYKITLMNNPFNKDVLWITFMLASTLIPTAVHLSLAAYSLLALYVTKPYLKKVINDMMELSKESSNNYKKYLIAKELAIYELAPLIFTFVCIAFLIVIFL